MNYGVFVERVRNKSTGKIQDPAWIRTLNTSQMLFPLSHSDPWQRIGRQATEAAEFQLILKRKQEIYHKSGNFRC